MMSTLTQTTATSFVLCWSICTFGEVSRSKHFSQNDSMAFWNSGLTSYRVSGQGKWINPPHDDANGPPYFCRAVRRGVKEAGSALNDGNVPLPWEANLCQYHTHETTAPCEHSKVLSASSGDAEQLASPPTPRGSPRTSSMPGTHKKVCKPQASKRR